MILLWSTRAQHHQTCLEAYVLQLKASSLSSEIPTSNIHGFAPWVSFNLMVHKSFSLNVYHKCTILVLDNMVLSSTNVLSHIHSFPDPQVECSQQKQLQLNQCPQQYHRIAQYPPQCSSIQLFRQFFRIINMSTNEVHINFSKLKIPLTSNKVLQLNFQDYLKQFLPKTIKWGKISELAQSHSNIINFKRHRSLTSSIWMVSVVESKVDIQPSPTDVHLQSLHTHAIRTGMWYWCVELQHFQKKVSPVIYLVFFFFKVY